MSTPNAGQEHLIALPHVEGIDPTLLGQVAQAAAKVAADIAAKDWTAAIADGSVLAGLVAQLFQPAPAPTPSDPGDQVRQRIP